MLNGRCPSRGIVAIPGEGPCARQLGQGVEPRTGGFAFTNGEWDTQQTPGLIQRDLPPRQSAIRDGYPGPSMRPWQGRQPGFSGGGLGRLASRVVAESPAQGTNGRGFSARRRLGTANRHRRGDRARRGTGFAVTVSKPSHDCPFMVTDPTETQPLVTHCRRRSGPDVSVEGPEASDEAESPLDFERHSSVTMLRFSDTTGYSPPPP